MREGDAQDRINSHDNRAVASLGISNNRANDTPAETPADRTSERFLTGLSPPSLRTSSRLDRLNPRRPCPSAGLFGCRAWHALGGTSIGRFRVVCMRYAAVILFAGLVAGFGGQESSNPLREVFLQRVEEYTAMHRRLEGPLPQQVVTADLKALFAPRMALAAAIRTARGDARQGDIFSPPVAGYFRTLVTDALRAAGVRDMLAIVEDENPVHIPAGVNGDYPAGRSIGGAAIPAGCAASAAARAPVWLRGSRFDSVGRARRTDRRLRSACDSGNDVGLGTGISAPK